MRQAILPILVFVSLGAAGDPYPKDVFRSPLGIDLFLSGSFGEMRANHFHTGLDIRTNGQTGYRIYAVADGWVERIAVSPTGYGNALYVNHDNGYQSVYGHLERFEGALADYVRSAQYARRSFAVDLAPERNRFRVLKGDVIAWSGNSGSSGGPHLHFEIRDAATSRPINPLLFGMPVKDTTPPRIHALRAYPLAHDARVEVTRGGRTTRASHGGSVDIPLVGAGPRRLAPAAGTMVRAYGRIGFGISTNDYQEGSAGRLGAYTVRLDADETTVYRHEMEQLDFALNRFLNAHVDYSLQRRTGQWIQRSFLLPANDRLPIYETRDAGVLEFEEGVDRALRYEVADAAGNTVDLSFTVRGASAPPASVAPTPSIPVAWKRETLVEREGIVLRFPPGALYEDIDLRYEATARPPGAWSRAHRVHDDGTPIHTPIEISLDLSDVPQRLRRHAVVARAGSRGGAVSEGGRVDGDFIHASSRSFGTFYVAVDTTSPSIRPINVSNGASMTGAASIRFRIGDDFSGVQSYEAFVDGEWVLFGHDAKTATIEHVFDGRITRGRHTLELRVVDAAGNEARYSATFTR